MRVESGDILGLELECRVPSKMWSQLGIVTHTFNSSTQGAETGRSLLETNPDFDLQSDFQDNLGYIVRSGLRGTKERWSHQIDAVPLSRFYF